MTTLGEIFQQNAARCPDKEAVVCESLRITYSQLNQRINRLAHSLIGLGLEKGDRVATLCLNCHRFVEIYGATAKAGLIQVPLNWRLKARELIYLMTNSGAKALLVDSPHEALAREILPALPEVKHLISFSEVASTKDESFSPSPPDLISYEELLSRGKASEPRQVGVAGDDLAYIIYTSGTTGLPKGAMLTHQGQLTNTWMAAQELKLSSEDVVLLVLPMFHVGALCSLWPNLYLGARAVIMSRFDPGHLLKLIEEERVTNLHLIQTMVMELLNHPDLKRYDLSSLKTLMYAGGPLPVEYIKRGIQELGSDVLIGFYGQTETGPIVSNLKKEEYHLAGPQEKVKRLASAGRPVGPIQVKIVNEEDKELPPGEVGEIVVKGPHLMTGYWGLPQDTREVFKGGWLHTGDLAYTDEEGYIFIVDRKKEMIKSGGENIYPREVEEVIYTHPAVAEVAVIGVPHERWGETVKALVVLKPGCQASEEEIIDLCREHLAGYKKPTSVEFVPSLPKSPSGKILKKELREIYWKGQEER